jgi:hypothetical protein
MATPDYAKMINQYLCFQAIRYYKEECIKRGGTNLFQQYIFDRSVWDSVFNRLHIEVQYYSALQKQCEHVPNYCCHEIYPTTLSYDDYLRGLYDAYQTQYPPLIDDTVVDKYHEQMWVNRMKNTIVYMVRLHLILDGYFNKSKTVLSSVVTLAPVTLAPVTLVVTLEPEEKAVYEDHVGYSFDAMPFYYLLADLGKTVAEISEQEPSRDNYELVDIDLSRYGRTTGTILPGLFDDVKYRFYRDYTEWRIAKFIS